LKSSSLELDDELEDVELDEDEEEDDDDFKSGRNKWPNDLVVKFILRS
jgi:hypothetical protein